MFDIIMYSYLPNSLSKISIITGRNKIDFFLFKVHDLSYSKLHISLILKRAS